MVDELSAERAAHEATRAQLAETESRRAVQHEAGVQLRYDRALLIAALEKARLYVKCCDTLSPMLKVNSDASKDVLAEIDALLAELREPPAREGCSVDGGAEG